MTEGFWVKYWMEYGRGHSHLDETYVFFKTEDGYSKEKDKENFEEFAYQWAGHDMGGFDMMGFTSGFEIVEKPPYEWLEKELIRIRKKQEHLAEHENLIKSELTGMTYL